MLEVLAGLERVELEDRAAVERAITLFSKGLDFADALHLSSSQRADGFATFDRALVSKARKAGAPIPVRNP